MIAQFNPFEVKISHHAKKRFLERRFNVVKTSKTEFQQADQLMREMLFHVYTQVPVIKGGHKRRHFMIDDEVFVLSKELDIVVTYYQYSHLSKNKVKQIRKSL
jgi:hypothetical protein